MIKVASLNKEHFSIINVPRTFRRITLSIANKEDIILVDRIVQEYITNP